MKINKWTGVILTLVVMSPYVLIYYAWVKHSAYSTELTCFFFVGILFHFLRKIEAGTKAELTFFEKATGHYWNDGFCLVPSLMPILHNIGIHPLWNLKKDIPIENTLYNPNINVNHFQDQKIPIYRVSANASLFQLSVHNFFSTIGGWFFSIDRSNPEMIYQRIGLKIILVAIIAGWIGNFIPEKTTPGLNNPTNNIEGTITIKTQLGQLPLSSFPTNDYFVVDTDQNTQHFTNFNGMRLFAYHKRLGENYPIIYVDGSLCVTVPAGERIGFKTKQPPVFATNMQKVTFSEKLDSLSFIKRNTAPLYYLFNGLSVKGFQETTNTWEHLHNNWDTVDSENFEIVSRAMDQKDILDKVAGGLVCF